MNQPSCRYGFHYVWINPYTRLGLCVRDSSYFCMNYNYYFGKCYQCHYGYMLMRSGQYYNYCAYIGWNLSVKEKNEIRKSNDKQFEFSPQSSLDFLQSPKDESANFEIEDHQK